MNISSAIMTPFPKIDGHFWIVRDGVIIDKEFKEYDYIKKFHNCDDGMVYKEADELTQTIITKMFERSLSSMGFDKKQFKKEINVLFPNHFPCFQSCFQNCLMEFQDGDEIKFGSMGWKYSNANRIWWEYGGEDWKSAKAFLK